MAKKTTYEIRVNDQATKELRRIRQEMGGLKGSVDKLEKGSGFIKLNQGLGLANKAFQVLNATVRAGVELVEKYGQQVAAEWKVKQVLEATGNAAGLTFDQLKDMASGLQDLTVYGDEVTMGAQAMLLTFKNIRGEAFGKTIELAMDLSTVFDQELKSSVMQLGKALENPAIGLGSLAEVGVTFTDEQKNMVKAFTETNRLAEAQGIIFEALEGQVGGAAQAIGDTPVGKLQQLTNAWGDMGEAFGGLIYDTLGPAIEWVTEQIGAITDEINKTPEQRQADFAVDQAKAQLEDVGRRINEQQLLVTRLQDEIERNADLQAGGDLKAQLAQSWQDTLATGANSTAQASAQELEAAQALLMELQAEYRGLGQTIRAIEERRGVDTGKPTTTSAPAAPTILEILQGQVEAALRNAGIVTGEWINREGQPGRIIDDNTRAWVQGILNEWEVVVDSMQADPSQAPEFIEAYTGQLKTAMAELLRIGQMEGTFNADSPTIRAIRDLIITLETQFDPKGSQLAIHSSRQAAQAHYTAKELGTWDWSAGGEQPAELSPDAYQTMLDGLQDFRSQYEQAITGMVDAVGGLFDQMAQGHRSAIEQMVANYDYFNDQMALAHQIELLQAEQNGQDTTDLQIEQLEEQYAAQQEQAKKLDDMRRAAFEAEKASRVLSIMMGTATAVVNALATPPAPVGIALAGTVGALGAAQLAVASSQQYIPQMAEGGIVPATPGGMLVNVGEAGYPEAIVPLDGRYSGGGDLHVHVHIDGQIVTDEATVYATIHRGIQQAIAMGATA